MDVHIRKLKDFETEAALSLVWEVFRKYEAPYYSKQGTEEFYRCIHDPQWLSMLQIYGAFEGETLVGIIAARNKGGHIALFFVKGMYHKKGIGRKLFAHLKKNSTADEITVNSSPYAVPVYRRLGFQDTDKEQVQNGIRYIPMKISTSGYNGEETMITYKYMKDFEKKHIAELFNSVGWYSGQFPDKLKLALHNSSNVISAWHGEKLVGLIRGLDDGIWQATIDCLLVNPQYQGKGVASKLLKDLLKEYTDFLYIDVVPDEKKNVAFYEKHGFKVMSEGTALQMKGTSWGE